LAEFEIASELSASSARVWAHAVSPQGVNAEFAPWLAMTFPAGVRDITDGWSPGERRFRSWLLAFGVLPVEYDDLVFVAVDRGRRFHECSTMFSQKTWEHERIIEATEDGCRVIDRIRFEPRVPLLIGLQAALFRTVFRDRHRKLRRLFG